MKKLLSANQAIAWAAYRGGCRVASAYPGTPSTEIMEHIAEFKGAINCEWSVNEKVAMEIAAGASLAGVRTLVAMKHVGLNVAMDPLMTFTYIGAIGGMVIVNADDPSLHSSQNEQDNRSLAKFAKCLLFEPSDSQEAYDMVLAGFELSEKYQVPVIIRTTTRTAHTSSIVDIGSGARGEAPAIPYVKNARRNVAVPANGRLMRFAVEKRSAQLRELTEASPFNRAEPGTGDIGFVASGVAYQYVKEVFPEAPVFKVGLSHPPPVEKIRAFGDLLDRQPQMRGKVSLVVVCVPAAKEMTVYDELQVQIEQAVGRVNGRYAEVGWTPIRFFFRPLPFEEVVAWYAESDVIWITPLRDGLNLVGKEYVATQGQTGGCGVLVLSEFAGAAAELHGALLTNPHDPADLRERLRQALEMDPVERESRLRGLNEIVHHNDVSRWGSEFLDAVAGPGAAQ